MALANRTPECQDGRCGECDGVAWDDAENHPVACECTCDCAPSLLDVEYIRQYVEEPDVLYIKPPDGGEGDVGLVER